MRPLKGNEVHDQDFHGLKGKQFKGRDVIYEELDGNGNGSIMAWAKWERQRHNVSLIWVEKERPEDE